MWGCSELGCGRFQRIGIGSELAILQDNALSLVLETEVMDGVLRIPAIDILFVVRTVREDQMLQEELPGYKDYAEHVRFRLIRGIW